MQTASQKDHRISQKARSACSQIFRSCTKASSSLRARLQYPWVFGGEATVSSFHLHTMAHSSLVSKQQHWRRGEKTISLPPLPHFCPGSFSGSILHHSPKLQNQQHGREKPSSTQTTALCSRTLSPLLPEGLRRSLCLPLVDRRRKDAADLVLL